MWASGLYLYSKVDKTDISESQHLVSCEKTKLWRSNMITSVLHMIQSRSARADNIHQGTSKLHQHNWNNDKRNIIMENILRLTCWWCCSWTSVRDGVKDEHPPGQDPLTSLVSLDWVPPPLISPHIPRHPPTPHSPGGKTTFFVTNNKDFLSIIPLYDTPTDSSLEVNWVFDLCKRNK